MPAALERKCCRSTVLQARRLLWDWASWMLSLGAFKIRQSAKYRVTHCTAVGTTKVADQGNREPATDQHPKTRPTQMVNSMPRSPFPRFMLRSRGVGIHQVGTSRQESFCSAHARSCHVTELTRTAHILVPQDHRPIGRSRRCIGHPSRGSPHTKSPMHSAPADFERR